MQKELTGFPKDTCYMRFGDGNFILERLVERLVFVQKCDGWYARATPKPSHVSQNEIV